MNYLRPKGLIAAVAASGSSHTPRPMPAPVPMRVRFSSSGTARRDPTASPAPTGSIPPAPSTCSPSPRGCRPADSRADTDSSFGE
jgi:hypothetical protein